MSIETDLKRMADANERIATALEFVVESIKGEGGLPEKKKKVTKEPAPAAVPTPAAAPVAPVLAPPLSGTAGISAFVPAAPVAPVAVAPVAVAQPIEAIQSGEELRQMAQRIAQKLGAETMPFVKWVTEMLIPYGVSNVVQVPTHQLQEVAAKLHGYATQKGITY